MEWDPHLYDEETNQPCIVNTSDLNEELGQVSVELFVKTIQSEAGLLFRLTFCSPIRRAR